MANANPLAWIGGVHEVYCLVLARDLTGHDLLVRLGASPSEMCVPQDEDEANEFLWSGMENYWSWSAAWAGESDSWAFSLEPASIWGALSARMERASGGTEALCCFTVDGTEFVEYWRDGALVVAIDTSMPHEQANRGGAEPDFLVEQMRRVGFFGEDSFTWPHRGLGLLHEVAGVSLEREQTILGLAGKLPAEGCGPEKAAAGPRASATTASGTSGGMGGAVGGPVGEASAPRAAGLARVTRGRGGKAGS
ncbi:DUF6461 domain-containing protein [Streptomyces sp. NEAU-S7GS2]|uniref:DUF6461 domain-containing protein n=1 Tax=Streptomyces sp. NEAU-S7GS2 TaxID=2202000 RepID=UPI000D6F37B8|nr:DUF6461 domain-containing protein [Streptomyces sp. NEAU-S7GS2]AWN24870.1 hypothetical protein DKG71_00585 [Streptomyces sp. NEAU-S7GS2]